MYPHAFRYHRAASLPEAASMIAELGEDAKLLAGGQSLIPLMKLRLSSPAHLVDLNFVPGVSYINRANGDLRLGAMARHAELAASDAIRAIPLLHDSQNTADSLFAAIQAAQSGAHARGVRIRHSAAGTETKWEGGQDLM
jgi:CO/xanthine dehydrogenase FAD-binding subunit